MNKFKSRCACVTLLLTSCLLVVSCGGGGGGGGGSGTNSNAITTTFYSPEKLATDSAGNIYVADARNNTIRKITPSGTVSTLAGLPGVSGSADGIGSSARFSSPRGIAVDSGGNVYVSDYANFTIRKVTPGGAVSTYAGAAKQSGSVDSSNPFNARFTLPTGLAVDGGGNVYVADIGSDSIRRISASGVVQTFAGSSGMEGSTDAKGSLARFRSPSGVSVDSLGNLYIADSQNNTIRKSTPWPDRDVSTFAGTAGASGSTDGTGSAARFDRPYDVAIDNVGNIFVVDFEDHTVRKIDSAGVVSTFAGMSGASGNADGIGAAARFNSPKGIATGGGFVYVADTENHTIRKIDPSGVVSTIAGIAGQFGNTDSAP